MMRRLAIAGLLLAAPLALTAQAAQAQVVRSYCDVESLGHDRLLATQRIYGESEQVPETYFDAVSQVTGSCKNKVSGAVARSDMFGRFVFAEVTMYTHREYLLSQGFAVDKLDTALELSCTANLIPADRDIPEEGGLVIQRAFDRARIDHSKLSSYDSAAVMTYVIASADHWRLGIALKLLPGCKSAN